MKKLFLLILSLAVLSCTTETVTNDITTADAKANVERGKPTSPKNTSDIILKATVTGTVVEELASMTVQESAANPKVLKWEVDPNTSYHVVILDSEGRWLLQTGTSGSAGFYISGYVVNRDPNDGNIYIVKGEQYYLYFSALDIKVPFTITGKI